MRTVIEGVIHQFNQNGIIIGTTTVIVEGGDDGEPPEEVASGFNLAVEKISEGEKND